MATEIGRPRDRRIDAAVLRATAELISDTGYADLAVYRRWPSKAHLVHEAVFPIGDATVLPDTGSVAGDVREMVRRTVMVLRTPAARAALPGLVAEMAADLTLHAALLERFGDILFRGLADRLQRGVARGEIRAEVTVADMVEALAGPTILALLTRGAALDDSWVDRTAALITRGISA